MTTTSIPTSRSREITDDDIRAYLPLVESHAARLSKRRVGVEYDDLVQEGMVSVWQSLRRGVRPELAIVNRMRDWIDFQARLRRNDSAPYGALLPIELGDAQ